MKSIDEIRYIVKEELQGFERIFDTAFTAHDLLLKKVLEHTKHRKGKQIRPLIVLLVGKLCGEINLKTHHAAAALEMLHSASLVHDDVVDNTYIRRKQPSVNAVFGNKAAVLAGDYMLTKAMTFMGQTGDVALINALVNLGEEITRGELLQLQHSYSIPSEDEYIEIVRKKTAILFSTCGSIAALAANAPEEKRDAITRFGDYLGICFQIKDDIFDYTPKADIGKPTFNDIREGKFTLPLIYSMRQLPKEEHDYLFKSVCDGNLDDDILERIRRCVENYGGIDYSERKIDFYREKAEETLSVFDDSPEKEALIDILDYVIQRNI